VERHLDLVRNDWKNMIQQRVAKVVVGDPGDFGVIVKPEADFGDWERVITDGIGLVPLEVSETIVERLTNTFHNSYLFTVGPHSDDECPFALGPVPMEHHEIDGEYLLPSVRRAQPA
jgi:hypothetical protein